MKKSFSISRLFLLSIPIVLLNNCSSGNDWRVRDILESVTRLRQSMKESADLLAEKNQDTQRAIHAKVDEEIASGNTKNEWVKTASETFAERTNEMQRLMNDYIKTIEEIGELDRATGELKNPGELKANYTFWMGNESSSSGHGNGKASDLRKKLKSFTDWANQKLNEYTENGRSDIRFENPALDPKDNRQVYFSEYKDWSWEYYTFHGQPLIANLATLESLKFEVLSMQNEMNNFFRSQLGAFIDRGIDSLIAISAPRSREVAVGMKFETQLFVVSTSNNIRPEFLGPGVRTHPGGNSATMTLQAMGGFAAGQNTKEQRYSAKIRVPKSDGTVMELNVQDKFIVRKPEVVITSASVQHLYMQCGNTMNIEVPALGEYYNPLLIASDADVLVRDEKTKVTIVPRGNVCVLNVKSNTNGQMIDVDNIKYKVIRPPKPVIVLMINGKEYNGTSPINRDDNAVLKLIPDADFRAALPADARYTINNIDLLAQKSLGAQTKVSGTSGSGKDAVAGIPVEMHSALKSEVPGTKIYFKIDKIYRINFQAKSIEEKFTERELCVGGVVK